MSTTAQPAVACPKCQNAMWDNRLTKRNPKQPDFKCKDRECDGVIWPPRPQSNRAPVSATAQPLPQPQSSGPYVPEIDGPRVETGAPPGEAEGAYAKLDRMLFVYGKCWAHALFLARRDLGNDASHEGMSAMAATLYISATNVRGMI